MTETNNDVSNAGGDTAKRKRAVSPKRQSVGYKAKWEDADQEAKRLRGVLGLAVTMLKKAVADDPKVTARIVEISIEMLEEAGA